MDMTCQISGNRLTLHLPADMREALGFQDGSTVTVHLVDGALVVWPQTLTERTLNELPADVPPEAPGGDLGRNWDAEDEVPSPPDHGLLTQITGLDWTQLQAVVHQGADTPPTISPQPIATNLAALRGTPCRTAPHRTPGCMS
ncbi:AbrB/MazE/SpoVT family DNA-binding domain-containing protein [Deinococcus sp. SDU3-2]|uniref:AbrB/MazE/SpoVT family DNA-binding domain-containing protein n=1 Tax=Deinococcus terrestris TaxID=2651870 RepID=A0A7X1TT21_9DEIO|nr:AbrB/MazE/SpoVT family DNA-binding domain-containing protein [Deinococcus terrestris]MPY67977.1 AbrB/MazE/SpoVT family DNA-binding domain-containing protein [Deinococcus terrestris]